MSLEMNDRHSPERAALARDAALRRLRRLTGGMIAVAVALSGALAGVAASSTHARKLVRRSRHVVRSAAAPTLPPAPSAPAQAAPSSSDEGSAPTPQSSAPAPPAQAPAPASAPPVVVSGGS
jgi:hypothetical protein